MTKRMIFPVLFGLVGVVILVMLGNWQMQRLEWKTEMLANIAARLSAAPVPLPDNPDPTRDRHLSVRVSGTMLPGEIHVLSSNPATGPGYRVIVAFLTDTGRRILVDRGIVPESQKNAARSLENGMITGNLLWAQDVDSFTPSPNFERNIWFSRAVEPLARALETEPVFLVQSWTTLSTGPLPVPVGVNIPNSHLGYAITWYGFAIVWLGMTLYLLWRIKRHTV